jgi:hypothetical protein
MLEEKPRKPTVLLLKHLQSPVAHMSCASTQGIRDVTECLAPRRMSNARRRFDTSATMQRQSVGADSTLIY